MSKRWRSAAAACAALAACLCLPAPEARAADWEWMIAPYFWGSDVSLDLTANDEPVVGADVGLSDLLDKVDIAGMVHVEGRGGRAGLFVDLLYLSLSDDRTISVNPSLPSGTLVSSELETGVYEVGGFYPLLASGRVLDLLAGARIIDMDQQSDITLPSTMMTSVGTSDTLYDGLVGLRYGQPIGGRWDFVIRGDVATGDTDLTWNALGTFGVRLGKAGQYNLRLGWRQMEIELEETDGGIRVETDIGFSGPAVGFAFKL